MSTKDILDRAAKAADSYVVDPGSTDRTEALRRAAVDIINAAPGSREALEAEHGEVYDTQQMTHLFEVEAFAAPFVLVRRISDGKRGSLMFQHSPRFYFGFEEA